MSAVRPALADGETVEWSGSAWRIDTLDGAFVRLVRLRDENAIQRAGDAVWLNRRTVDFSSPEDGRH